MQDLLTVMFGYTLTCRRWKKREKQEEQSSYMSISMVEGAACLGAGGGTGGAQVHWQRGQGDKEGGGGEEGLGLGQQDPEGDVGGRTETGREPDRSGAGAGAETGRLGGSTQKGKSETGSGVSSLLTLEAWRQRAPAAAPDTVRQEFGSV